MRERNEVVVPRIAADSRMWQRRIRSEIGETCEIRNEPFCFLEGEVATQARPRQDRCELPKQRRRGDQLDPTIERRL